MFPKIVLPKERLQRKELNVDSDSEFSQEELKFIHKKIPFTAHKKLVTPQSRLHFKLPPLSQKRIVPNPAQRRVVVKTRAVSRYGRRNTTTWLSSSESDTESESNHSSEILDGDTQLQLDEKLPEDVQHLFHFMKKYTPRYINLKTVYKPYIPALTPAVGDVEAFLKIIPPALKNYVPEEEYKNISDIGKEILDEPATVLTDSDVFQMQLRTFGYQTSEKVINFLHLPVKKVEGCPKNDCKVIEKWITDVSNIQNTKSLIISTNPMLNIREIVANWSQKMKKIKSVEGIPKPELQCSLEEYLESLYSFFDIPLYKRKVYSLHSLFSFYTALKETENIETVDSNLRLSTLTKHLMPPYDFKMAFHRHLQNSKSNPSKYQTLK